MHPYKCNVCQKLYGANEVPGDAAALTLFRCVNCKGKVIRIHSMNSNLQSQGVQPDRSISQPRPISSPAPVMGATSTSQPMASTPQSSDTEGGIGGCVAVFVWIGIIIGLVYFVMWVFSLDWSGLEPPKRFPVRIPMKLPQR